MSGASQKTVRRCVVYSRRHIERALNYAFLAPDLIKAIAEGRLPLGVNASVLADAPMAWSQQWRMLGLDPRQIGG